MELRDSSTREPLLRFGPGPRLDRAARLVEAVAAPDAVAASTAPEAPARAPRLSRWSDVSELLFAGPRDRVVLDADHLSLEDIGIVRRFLASRPEAAVECIGADRTTPVGRALLALPRTRWHPWPLELAHVEALLAGPARASGLVPELAPELRRAPPPPPSSDPLRPAPDPQGTPPRNGHARGAESLGLPLSDLVSQLRRAHATLAALRASGAVEAPADEALGSEFLRLERTVRSLALGSDGLPQEIELLDLEALVEEELAVVALHSRGAPRVRFQGGGPLPVRADRASLVHALGVLLDLVRALASAGEPIEVQAQSSASDSAQVGRSEGGHSSVGRSGAERSGPGVPADRAVVRLRAPAAALEGTTPAQWLEPGGLGERVPGVGASELSVLARLCAARGMDLKARFVPGEPRRVEFDLALPLATRLQPQARTERAARAEA